MGRLGVRSVMFAGEGEPLLHPQFIEMVTDAREAGLDVGLTTNGTPCSDDTWARLLPLLTWVKFSVDAGTAGVYAKVHGVAEAMFERTMASIASALRAKTEGQLPVTIGVQFLLVEENVDDVEHALDRFSSFGLDYFVIKPYSLHPRMLRRHDETYDEKLIERIEEMVADKASHTKTELVFRADALRHYAEHEIRFSSCRALPFWGYISSGGDFYTCSVFLGDDRFRVGNIGNESMATIFSGTRRAESVTYGREELAVGETCRLNCRMARVNEFLDHLARPPAHVNFV
jgi:radical SAM protein with 4Fe4S-binding SPASM domain